VGVDFYREGDSAGGVTILLSGLGYRYKQLTNGRRQIVAYLLPGDVVSMGVLFRDPNDHGVRFIEPSMVSTIHPGDLSQFMPQLLRSLWLMVARELAITWEWVANVGQRDTKARIAHLFCELYYRMLEIGEVHDGSLRLPVSQQEIADTVGVTIVHTNRTLQILRKEGLIVFDNGVLSIPDIRMLKTAGMFTPDYLHLDRFDAIPAANAFKAPRGELF
jgi:CRP-like cAMP-binding protein